MNKGISILISVFTGDLSGYNQAIVIVNTANNATYLPTPDDGYVVWYDTNKFTCYFNESEGVIASIDGSNPNITITKDGELNKEDGEILRYMMLSKDFVKQRYGGSLPFNLPCVYTIKRDLVDAAGLFDPSDQHIEIDPTSTEFTTISHEYGHFVNYRF